MFLTEHWTHDLRSRKKNGATSCTKEDRKRKNSFTYVHFSYFISSGKMSLKADVLYRKISDPALEGRIVKPSISHIFVVLFVVCKPELLQIHWKTLVFMNPWMAAEERKLIKCHEKLTMNCPRLALLWEVQNNSCKNLHTSKVEDSH